MLFRYPELHEVTRSRIGIPASARANVAAFMQADLVPENKVKKAINMYNKSDVCKYSSLVFSNLHLLGELGRKCLSDSKKKDVTKVKNIKVIYIYIDISGMLRENLGTRH